MKTILKIILPLLLLLSFSFGIESTSAGVKLPDATKVKKVSINTEVCGNKDAIICDDIIDIINNVGFSLLRSIKLILSGVLVIFMVYIGVQMIMSMGGEEEELNKAKNQIWYSTIALVFINIPGSIYEVLKRENTGTLDSRLGYSSRISDSNDSNIFFDFFDFGYTVNENIVGFMEVLIFGIAIFVIVLSGIKIIASRGKEEDLTEGKNKIMYSILALIFVGFIESWKLFAFKGKISDGTKIFETVANLSLFLAGPIAIFFLTLAGYYYITSGGDEEKVKKAKTIVVNTVIATVILLASYAFLLDLADLL